MAAPSHTVAFNERRMKRKMKSKTLVLIAAGLVGGAMFSPGASATDGHLLHGVGAINSAMGGVGVAMPRDVLGAAFTNPAGLMAFSDGSRADFSFEMFKPTMSVASAFPEEMGGFSGSTDGITEWTPIPALGWSTPVGDRAVIGLSGLGIGGFGVNYAGSGVSPQGVPDNPVLAPTAAGGFGQVYSNFQLMKISPAIAFEATESFWLGVALNFDWASLAVMPAPFATPDMGVGVDPGTGQPVDRGYYPDATAADAAFGVGFQAGLTWLLSDAWSIGLAYTSPQWFQEFEFNTTNKAPGSQTFGFPREISFRMDVPATYAAGVALSTERYYLGADLKYITYSSTKGFDEKGFGADGAVQGFGWEDIMVIAVGGDYVVNDRLVLRGGYNYSDNPIPDEQSFFNIPAPAIVQQHFTGGLGIRFAEDMELSLTYYHVLENSISGPMYGPMGPMTGTSVTSTMSENSVIIGFSLF
jgi:long-chain fatty acid transport protein